MHNLTDTPIESNPYLLGYHRTHDVEEHANSYNHWDVRLDQLSSGKFEGEVISLQLDGMQMMRDRANQSISKNGASSPSSITFSLSLKGPDAFRCAGRRLDDVSHLIARSSQHPEIQAPKDSDVLYIDLDEAELAEALGRQRRKFRLEDLPKCYRRSQTGDPEGLAQLARGLLDSRMLGSPILNHAGLLNGVRDAVLLNVLDLLDADIDCPPLTPTARKRTVDRARAYAETPRDSPLSILELCNFVGASRRKLQYSFQEIVGINPVAYLRTIRLNAVHRALLQSAHPCSVQDIALSWGFLHLSRFAIDYAKLFGEKPSETVRRVRGCVDRNFAKTG
ncbi:helix-turn-helix domain-containing protein [Cupriavidus basilensis]|uniref:Helix-turn-helix domain-containing protein n=1 Tax=Cupriavidus basilensis TaxID=68895 RepID=A0A643FLD0_9BURK|nr:helix-turn-helix domain-containing protein [Cupriavidus basilensis]QOT82048.1 helix-turn-helix domain-containing protein [Cupriavidus basilensis]